MIEENQVIAELKETAQIDHQLATYVKLHAEEMQRFQEQFAAFQRIQADELQMLQSELNQLKQEIALLEDKETKHTSVSPSSQGESARLEPTLSRRDLLTGKIPLRQRNQS
jgi:hypothetical protein